MMLESDLRWINSSKTFKSRSQMSFLFKTNIFNSKCFFNGKNINRIISMSNLFIFLLLTLRGNYCYWCRAIHLSLQCSYYDMKHYTSTKNDKSYLEILFTPLCLIFTEWKNHFNGSPHLPILLYACTHTITYVTSKFLPQLRKKILQPNHHNQLRFAKTQKPIDSRVIIHQWSVTSRDSIHSATQKLSRHSSPVDPSKTVPQCTYNHRQQ